MRKTVLSLVSMAALTLAGCQGSSSEQAGNTGPASPESTAAVSIPSEVSGTISLREGSPQPSDKATLVLNLADVSMTFFMPEAAAGRLAMGSEVRIVLDAAPAYVIPAEVSFVASQAQFTPKTVETASERQKLMFRVKARLPVELLLQHLEQVKTGLPGVAWVRTDPARPWPESLAVRLPGVQQPE